MSLKLGRRSPYPRETHPRLTLENYMNSGFLPNLAGVTVDWCSKVPSWPMYLNDRLGDCTEAAKAHIIQAISAYASVERKVQDLDVERWYERDGGYVLGDSSTDNGCVIQDVLKNWESDDSEVFPIAAYAEIRDCTNVYLLKQALDLFGTVYLGINCPSSALEQFNAGEIWSYVPSSPIEGGHAIVLQRQYPAGGMHGVMDVITWGAVQPMTFKFAENYIEEAWIILTDNWISSLQGLAPNGLDLTELQKDFAQITGK